jgi:uncharacterized iron-regulated membrane protein
MRLAFTLVHRWLGLAIALFLFVSGLTGAVISWDHELDDILNPHLVRARADGSSLPALVLKEIVERRDTRARVTYLPLAAEPGRSLVMSVMPRVDPATGSAYPLDYNQVFVDPATGEELGRRDWGAAWPITTQTFVSFLYRLHYSLHIPEMWGIDEWGVWFMGVVAIVWTLDCFVGFYLTLPPHRVPQQRPLRRDWLQRWKSAWKIKFSGSAYRINFDIHRAFGLWTWALLFILAFTGFSLNLYREVFYPLMSLVSEVTPTPYEQRDPTHHDHPIEPRFSFAAMLEIAQVEGMRRRWSDPVTALFYAPHYGVFAAKYSTSLDDRTATGVPHPRIFFDGQTGRALGERLPWTGTAADIFVQAQFPLHSGRILGFPGRILVSVMGLVVAALSVTGVVIWHRKRRARLAGHRQSCRGAGLATRLTE